MKVRKRERVRKGALAECRLRRWPGRGAKPRSCRRRADARHLVLNSSRPSHGQFRPLPFLRLGVLTTAEPALQYNTALFTFLWS